MPCILILLSYKLVIRATDRGTPALHTDLVIRVIVDDVNEHEPKFEHLLSANIPEDLSVGVAVLKVRVNRFNDSVLRFEVRCKLCWQKCLLVNL